MSKIRIAFCTALLAAIPARADAPTNGSGTVGNGSGTLGKGTFVNGAATPFNGSGTLGNGASSPFNGAGALLNGSGTLSNGSGTLSNGSGTLSNGSGTLSNGSGTLSNGSGTLSNGSGTLSNGSGTLSNGSGTLSNGSGTLGNGAAFNGSGTLSNGSGTLSNGSGTLSNGSGTLSNGSGTLSNGSGTLSNGSGTLSNGSGTLSNGSGTLSNGSGTLSNGSGTLSNGSGTLSNGSGTLSNGSGTLSNGSGTLSNGSGTLSNGSGMLSNGSGTLSNGSGTLSNGSGTLSNGTCTVSNSSGTFTVFNCSGVINGSGTLGNGSGTLGNGSGTLGNGSGTLGNGSGTLGNGSGTLGNGSGTLGNGSGTLGNGTNIVGSGGATSGVDAWGVPIDNPYFHALENSLLFGNAQVHDAWINRPFTAAELFNDGSADVSGSLDQQHHQALFQVWNDPFSVMLLSYFWADAHIQGDDLVFCPAEYYQGTPAGRPCQDQSHSTITFAGSLGLCDYDTNPANLRTYNPYTTVPRTVGSRGWAVDQPLTADAKCQHWVSAVFLGQNNQLRIHNRFSARGPSNPAPDSCLSGVDPQTGQPTQTICGADRPEALGTQLNVPATAIPLLPFVHASEIPVNALMSTCPADSAAAPSGFANCDWTPGLIGTCSTPGATIALEMTSALSKPIVMQVQQGVNGVDFPYAPLGACYPSFGATPPSFTPPCQGEVLGFSAGPSTLPSVSFSCPASGTFSVQWAPWQRSDAAALQAEADGTPSSIFPAFTVTSVNGQPSSAWDTAVYYQAGSEVSFGPTVYQSLQASTAQEPDTSAAWAALASYPANEVQIFPPANIEAYFAGNIFGPSNVQFDSVCEVRAPNASNAAVCPPQPLGGPSVGTVCEQGNQACCVPCRRLPNVLPNPEPQLDQSDELDQGILGAHGAILATHAFSTVVNYTDHDFLVTQVQVAIKVHASAGRYANIVVVLAPAGPENLQGGYTLSPQGAPSADGDTFVLPTSQGPDGAPASSANPEFPRGSSTGDDMGTDHQCYAGTCKYTVPITQTLGPPGALIPAHGAITVEISVVSTTGGDGVPPLATGDDYVAILGKSGTAAFSDRTSPPYWTGAQTGGCGHRCLVNFRPYLVVSGYDPAAPPSIFPNAHLWLSNKWGPSADYYLDRGCSSDLSTCFAHYEGKLEEMCSNLSADGASIADVAGCQLFDKNGIKTPLLFNEGGNLGSYPGYGVTTFLPNYKTGLDAPVALASGTSPGGGSGGSAIVSKKGNPTVTADGGQCTGSVLGGSRVCSAVAYDGNPHPGSGRATGSAGERLSPVTLAYYDSAGNALPGAPVGVGTYAVVASFAGNDQYNPASSSLHPSDRSALISITGPITVSADNQSIGHGSAIPPLTASYSGALSGSPACTTTATATSNVGTYPITCTLGTLSSAIPGSFVFIPGTLTIAPLPASVTPNPASKIYGAADPQLAGTLWGFSPGDTVTATYSRTAGETVSGGPYAISATLTGALGNYNITYNTAAFTIAPASTAVALGSSTNPSTASTPVMFTARVSPIAPGAGVPTGTVSFREGPTLLGTVTLSGGAATFSTAALSAGSHSLTATYAGDSNFTGSTSAALAQNVEQPSLNLGLEVERAVLNVGENPAEFSSIGVLALTGGERPDDFLVNGSMPITIRASIGAVPIINKSFVGTLNSTDSSGRPKLTATSADGARLHMVFDGSSSYDSRRDPGFAAVAGVAPVFTLLIGDAFAEWRIFLGKKAFASQEIDWNGIPLVTKDASGQLSSSFPFNVRGDGTVTLTIPGRPVSGDTVAWKKNGTVVFKQSMSANGTTTDTYYNEAGVWRFSTTLPAGTSLASYPGFGFSIDITLGSRGQSAGVASGIATGTLTQRNTKIARQGDEDNLGPEDE